MGPEMTCLLQKGCVAIIFAILEPKKENVGPGLEFRKVTVVWTTEKCPDRALARRKGMFPEILFFVKSVVPNDSPNNS